MSSRAMGLALVLIFLSVAVGGCVTPTMPVFVANKSGEPVHVDVWINTSGSSWNAYGQVPDGRSFHFGTLRDVEDATYVITVQTVDLNRRVEKNLKSDYYGVYIDVYANHIDVRVEAL